MALGFVLSTALYKHKKHGKSKEIILQIVKLNIKNLPFSSYVLEMELNLQYAMKLPYLTSYFDCSFCTFQPMQGPPVKFPTFPFTFEGIHVPLSLSFQSLCIISYISQIPS